MIKSEMNQIVDKILSSVKETRDEGQKEYARDESDVFANFKRVASYTGQTKESVLMTYLLKHIDGINAFISGHKSQRESVHGRITDAIVYLCLLWAMTEEK